MCGSRDWTDRDAITTALTCLPAEHVAIEVLHGDARGADRLAAEAATDLGFTVRAFPADWEFHGRRAGIMRNLRMLDERPDKVIAFQRNGSRGTQHTIDEARRRGISVEVIRTDANQTSLLIPNDATRGGHPTGRNTKEP